jgi:hypothetical protein
VVEILAGQQLIAHGLLDQSLQDLKVLSHSAAVKQLWPALSQEVFERARPVEGVQGTVPLGHDPGKEQHPWEALRPGLPWKRVLNTDPSSAAPSGMGHLLPQGEIGIGGRRGSIHRERLPKRQGGDPCCLPVLQHGIV